MGSFVRMKCADETGALRGLRWWSSGSDSMLLTKGAGVRSLGRKLDLTSHNQEFEYCNKDQILRGATETQCSQMNN